MNDPEIYIDAALASLRANLPTWIGYLNGLYSDFQLATPANDERYLFGGEDDTDTIIGFPAVVVAVPDISYTGFSLDQTDWDVSPSLVVQAWIEQDEQVYGFQQLYRASTRYGRAIKNTLLAPDAFGASIRVKQLREAYRVNPETQDRGVGRLSSVTQVYTLDDVERPDG